MIEKSDIMWGISLGVITLMMMVGFIIVFIVIYQKRQLAQEKKLFDIQREHQKGLLATALDSEEAERRRIAQDLHDDIGVMLSLTKMSMNQLHAHLKKQEQEMTPPLDKARELLDETITHVRKITRDLVPTTLEQFGLEAAIEEFIGKLDGNGGPQVLFEEDSEPLPRHAPKVELSLFRVVQELVNNAVKHAACDQIHIRLEKNFESLKLAVRDNGVGFDPEKIKQDGKAGLGLRNIESRLSIIGGAVNYFSVEPGTLVEITVPLVREMSAQA